MYWEGVAVYDHTGSFHPGWPRPVRGMVRSSPALADLDGDGRLDIVLGTSRTGGVGDSACVYVFSDGGIVRPGWPAYAEGDFESSPVIGDIDGDGEMEVIIGCTDCRVYAYNRDGSRLSGWPRRVTREVYSTPVLSDLDADGDVEVAVGGYDALMHVLDLGAPCDSALMDWPGLCHDNYNSNVYGGPPQSSSAPGLPDGAPARLSLVAYPSPAASRMHIRLGVPSSKPGDYSVDVFDVRGRLIRELAGDHMDAGYHSLVWDGRDGKGLGVSSGIYFIKVAGAGGQAALKVLILR
jgi:hypothetical protein